ncbi:MAG: hypothetical protein IKW30_04510 [Lachnospiraceae bacterium]|nr:hypothetical protein [Lachnospiraceae bacterium]
MEDNKQITEQKITYSKVLKAMEDFAENEKELIFTGNMIEILRYVCGSEEELERYKNICSMYINTYQTYLKLAQRVYDIVNKK